MSTMGVPNSAAMKSEPKLGPKNWFPHLSTVRIKTALPLIIRCPELSLLHIIQKEQRPFENDDKEVTPGLEKYLSLWGEDSPRFSPSSRAAAYLPFTAPH